MFSFRSVLTYFATAFTFSVGGGIGEAALMGALFGGAKAAVTGEDLVEGALLGGVTGGAMGGVSSLLGAGAGAAGTSAVTTGANTAAEQAINSSANMLQATAPEIGMANSFNPLTGAPLTPAVNQGISALPGTAVTGGVPDAAQAALSAQQAGASTTPISDFLTKPGLDITQNGITDPSSMAGKGAQWWKDQGIGGRAMYTGLGGAAYGVANPVDNMPEEEKYVSKFAGYNRDEFTPYEAQRPNPYPTARYAAGGIANLQNQQSGMYPQSQQVTTQYATPSQMPTSAEVVNSGYEPQTNAYTGAPVGFAVGGSTGIMGGQQNYMGMGGMQNANGAGYGMGNVFSGLMRDVPKSYFNRAEFNAAPNAGQPNTQVYRPKYENYAEGGIAGFSLGGYAAGGNPRLLSGPGDGVSDGIPATIGGKQPARLADGEFVVPARIVSELGNGSTDAGAKRLYAMMDRVKAKRRKAKDIAADTKSYKLLPA